MYRHKKIIITEAKPCDTDSYGDYHECDPYVQVNVISDEVDLAKQTADMLADKPALEALLENEHFRRGLTNLGWVDAKQQERLADKIKYDGKFYYTDSSRSYSGINEIDPERIPASWADELGKKSTIFLRGIDKNSLKEVAPKVWEAHDKAQKKAAVAAKAQAERAKATAEAKKQKEIEKAQKLLEKAGLKAVPIEQ